MPTAGSERDESDEIRALIADAVSTLDFERVADALIEAVQRTLSPLMVAGFTLAPGKPVELRRFVIDPGWDGGLAYDFRWMAPLLELDVKNGASVIGPELCGASQIAAVIDIGTGRFSYLVVVGEYADPESARKRLADIASETGLSTRTMRTVRARATDLATLRERERLSRDLHDSLSQSLWSLSMLSETAHSMTGPDDPLHALVSQIAEISLTSQEEMRSLLINLRSAEPSRETIAGVLESLVTDFRASHDIEVVASIAEADLDADAVMSFRRIAEEAMNNVARHANASTVAVVFDAYPVLTLRIGDDGVGFDAKPVKGHLGLRIMEERAEEVGCDFEVSSVPGVGTLVTASVDRSRARPLPGPRRRPALPSLRQALQWLMGGALLSALAVGLFFGSRSYRSDAEQVQADLDALAVVQERVSVSRAWADEATALLLQGVGQADAADVSRATTARANAIEDARETMEPLADLESFSGEHARQLLDEVGGASGLELGGDGMAARYGEALAMLEVGMPSTLEPTRPIHSLINLAILDQVVTFSLLESMAARYAMTPDSFTPTAPMRDFYAEVAVEVRRSGGYLGPDASIPLQSGYLPTAVALVHEREAVEALNGIIVDVGLWEDDQWLQRWSAAAGPPPTTIEEYVERSATASVAGRAVIDARYDDQRSELSALRYEKHRLAQFLLVGAGVFALSAVLAFSRSSVVVLRRKRALAVNDALDPLTGIGNRSVLDTGVARLLGDPDMSHHVVATLDLDRFTFINDVHGREFGDRMLEVIGIGLDAMTRYFPGVHGVAVRLGGDEFMITFHSAEGISLELIHRAMNRLRCTIISTSDGALVRCSFSYGIVAAEGSPDLGSMMAASDLAAYEDRARLKS